MYNVPIYIQTFSVNGKFTERYHIFCALINLFTILFCSRYRLWATIRLLYHFGFVMCLNSRLYRHIFHATDAKYVMFRVGWRKSLKGSTTPDSKSHTPGLKHICTCTLHWLSHSETTPNPTLQDWNIPALVLRIDTPTLKLLQILHSRTETYLHLY